ncbi:hypothetical protein ABKU60_23790, partial [Enterobacter roggenkampii]
GGKNSLNRLIRCVCGKKIGPDPRNFNQRVSLGRNDLLIRTFPRTVNQMIKDNVFTELELKREYNYSYAGAANATLSENGYHPLKFKNGIEGAGLCVKTVYGDGGYLIYGERYKGDLVRIFIELR